MRLNRVPCSLSYPAQAKMTIDRAGKAMRRMLAWNDPSLDRETDQFRNTSGLHLCHQFGPIDFDRAGAQIELAGDFLVGLSVHKAFQYLRFALTERGEPGHEFRAQRI